jgi:hypothetical protein
MWRLISHKADLRIGDFAARGSREAWLTSPAAHSPALAGYTNARLEKWDKNGPPRGHSYPRSQLQGQTEEGVGGVADEGSLPGDRVAGRGQDRVHPGVDRGQGPGGV